MTVRLITPPAEEPVTLEMARLHTRAEAVEDDSEDVVYEENDDLLDDDI